MLKEVKRRVAFGVTLLLLAGLAYAFGRNLQFPSGKIHLDTALSQLPYYAAYSLMRMLFAYLLSFFFSVLYGYVAATVPKAEGPMIAILDVLQSIPILGFFPVAVFFFVNLFQGSRWGVEVASVVLIFTSMAWNMAFSVYESFKTIPNDLIEAADGLGIRGWLKFEKALFPICIPKLIYSSMISWAGGWYFLIACEIIAIGSIRYHLPGLGSFLIESVESGQLGRTLYGLLFLIAIIVLLDLFIWRPLAVWGEKFRYEFTMTSAIPPTSFALQWYRRFRTSPLWRWTKAVVATSAPVLKLPSRLLFPEQGLAQRTRKVIWRRCRGWIGYVTLAAVFFVIGWSFFLLIQGLARPLPKEADLIPIALLASFLRLAVAYLLALAWTLPVAFWVGENPHAAHFVTPIAEIGASIPATALFPFFILLAVHVLGGMNGAAILLILTGMQWYLLFNLIGGVQSIPGDLKEAAKALGVSKWLYWRRLYLPAVFPSLVTGSITAWGGGWNALIVAEYVVYRRETYSVTGIGALLDRATYEAGNEQMMLLSLITMVVTITLLNRFFWRRLYLYAVEHYKIDY
ncbi:MAG: ABC transporter permease subunit [Nitrospirae bacterium]|nr:ABC transporter permease subunit [Candidatus Manganitrophaceae bacterium]